MFRNVQACLNTYTCSVGFSRVDAQTLRVFVVSRDDFLLRLIENPMVFEHESFTSLILALNHITGELKARGSSPHCLLQMSVILPMISVMYMNC